MKKDYVCIPLALVRAKDVGPTAMRIYALLAAGTPPRELAGQLGVTPRAVRLHLAALRAAGWLGADGRPAAGGYAAEGPCARREARQQARQQPQPRAAEPEPRPAVPQRPGGYDEGKAEGAGLSNRLLIGDLGDAFLAIPGMRERYGGDAARRQVYARIGRAYAKYDYEAVLAGVEALRRREDAARLRDPLAYLNAVAREKAARAAGRAAGGAAEEERRRREEAARNWLAARNAELEAALKRDPDMIRRARERLARQREEARREREAREAEKARALERLRETEARLAAEEDEERKMLLAAQARALRRRLGLAEGRETGEERSTPETR